jgi:hypothetical protein
MERKASVVGSGTGGGWLVVEPPPALVEPPPAIGLRSRNLVTPLESLAIAVICP